MLPRRENGHTRKKPVLRDSGVKHGHIKKINLSAIHRPHPGGFFFFPSSADRKTPRAFAQGVSPKKVIMEAEWQSSRDIFILQENDLEINTFAKFFIGKPPPVVAILEAAKEERHALKKRLFFTMSLFYKKITCESRLLQSFFHRPESVPSPTIKALLALPNTKTVH